MLADDAARWQRIDALFAQLLDLPPAERGAFLDRCGGDAALRRTLEELLQVQDAAATFLDAPPDWFCAVLLERLARP